jgi:glutamate/tyrosine decarboxylase-like PLP-dependent enzyme
MNEIFAYTIGPKAENMEVFRNLIVEAMDDYMFWRRNFYPEDTPVIRATVRSSEEFNSFIDHLRDTLFTFLNDAKKGVPFFSPRYIGHMNADLVMPSMVGYFAAMLYNSNNVAGESSPVTVQLENEVIRMLLKMVGMDPELGWGYLTPGGTSANIFSLWVARNLRTLPLSIRAMLARVDAPMCSRVAEKLRNHASEAPGSVDVDQRWTDDFVKQAAETLRQNLVVETAQGEEKELLGMSIWELCNLPVGSLGALRSQAIALVRESWSDKNHKAASLIFDELTEPFLLKSLGIDGFRRTLAQEFPEADWLTQRPWTIFLAENRHYSWPKAADVLGFGNSALVPIATESGFDLNVASLRDQILKIIETGNSPSAWPFFLVSTFGSTEEGALDNLPAIVDLAEELRKVHGMTLWNHVDACYGGYFAAMVRRNSESQELTRVGSISDPGTLKHWLAECGRSVGLGQEECDKLIEMSETGSGGWLSWQDFVSRTAALAHADSISIDPHKLGYVPYPAGVVLLKKKDAREIMSGDAPYLWSGTSDEDFTGRYTLEGSRPGSAAAACWLAHKTISLDQDGHGKILALSILGTRRLYRTLKERLCDPHMEGRVALIHRPHTNMLCYVPYHTSFLTLEDTRSITEHVLKQLHPKNEVRPYMAVGTQLRVTKLPLEEGLEARSLLEKMLEDSELPRKLQVIRSVVMGPFTVNAQTRSTRQDQPRSVFDAYAEHLSKVINESAASLAQRVLSGAIETWERPWQCIIMDDDPGAAQILKRYVTSIAGKRFSDQMYYLDSEKATLERVRNHDVPLDLAILDINMSGSSDAPKGGLESGYKVYEAILERNQKRSQSKFRVQLVYFFSIGYGQHQARLAEIQARFPEMEVPTIDLDKASIDPNATVAERTNAFNKLTKELSKLKIRGEWKK